MFSHSTPIFPRGSFQVACEKMWGSFGVGDHFGSCLDRFWGSFEEGDNGVYGIAVLSFFSSGISVISILTCGITVLSSPVVCGFLSFWLTVFGKRRSFTVFEVPFICALLSNTGQYTMQNKTQ